jgi:PAS domain S-box-containing protein
VTADPLDPLHHPGRLRAVRATGLADGSRSAVLDGLARAARHLLGTPGAVVTLLDDRRQYMPGTDGMDYGGDGARTAPLSRSVCRFALGSTEPLVIDDLHTHHLTRNDTELQQTGVRAYLGIPLADRQGHVLGVMCAVDTMPRAWSADDIATLEDVARAARSELVRSAVEERFHLAVEATGEVLYSIYPASGFVWREGAMLAIYGRTAAEVDAELEGWIDCLHPDDRTRVVASWESVIASPADRWECEYRMVQPTGRVVTVRDRARITRNEAGTPVLIAGAVEDVTAERTAQTELQESESRMRTVLDTIRDGVVLQDRSDTILLSNPAAARILGLTEDQLHGRSSYDPRWQALKPDGSPFRPDEHPSVVAMRTGQVQSGVLMQVARPDGSRAWLSIDSQPIRRPDGGANAVLTTFRDVTREREAVQAAAHLAAIVSSSGMPIISTATDGTIQSWNRAAETFFRLPASDMLGTSIWRLVPADHVEAERAAMAAATAGQVQEIETERVRPTGVRAPVSLTISPVIGDGGQVIGLATVVRDLSARRELEVELRQAQKLEAMGRLAGGVAHDFNNLLTAIRGNAELMRAVLPDDDPQAHDDLEEIVRTVERAASLTRQLLTFSRKQVVRVRPLYLNRTIAGTMAMLRRIIGEDLHVTFDPDPTDPVILADPGQVEQVLMNLAVNARDAMPSGGSLLISTVELPGGRRPPGAPNAPVFDRRYVVLSVRDTGTGMDEATRLNAFEPFFTTKGEGKGTGLGLSTVYGIAAQCDGVAWITSVVGVGTTVSVAVPAQSRHAMEHSLESVDLSPTAGHGTVLLVEDDPAVLETITRSLSRAGYHVLRAGSADAAIRRLVAAGEEGTPVNAVITDLVMPGGGGHALLAHIRATQPTLPVLVVSGYSGDERFEVPQDLRLRFLPKPFGPNELLEGLHSLLT